MAAISTQQRIESTSVGQGGTFNNNFEVTNYKSASVLITKTGIGKGAAKLQWSNDGTNWIDINTTLNPQATATVAATDPISYHLAAESVPGAWVRVNFVEDGTAAVTVSGRWIGKLY